MPLLSALFRTSQQDSNSKEIHPNPIRITSDWNGCPKIASISKIHRGKSSKVVPNAPQVQSNVPALRRGIVVFGALSSFARTKAQN